MQNRTASGFSTTKTERADYNALLDDTQIEAWGKSMTRAEYYREHKRVEGKVTDMTPEEYIRECTKGAWTGRVKEEWQDIESFQDFLVEIRADDREKIEMLKEALQSSVEVDMPVLEYAPNGNLEGQEGLHRAVAALELGILFIPVLVVHNLPDKEEEIEWS